MSKLDPALWRDMMDYLRRRHAPICRQWFEQLEPVEFDSGLMQVRTANRVQQKYLQGQCRDQFTEAAQAVTGNLVAVHFVDDTATGEGPAATRGDAAAGTGADRHSDGRALPGLRGAVAGGGGPRSRAVTDLDRDQIVLSPDYSFDNFISGPNNQLAYAASVAVANQPGSAYNPLFIHGGVGLGKTHLLQAICQRLMEHQPDIEILYVSCDSFMNQFIECVQSGQMNEFRHRYRHVNILVIDDIHFLGNRERSQEEFFHTFNELYQSNRQIVLSSDAAPTEIPHLEERLLSRFQWGLVANVTRPHYETRVAILRAKARLRGIELPDDVIGYIATRIDSNARELEGAMTTVQAHAAVLSKSIDLALAQEALGEQPASEARNSQITLQQIIDTVTAFYNVRLSDLQSRRRHKSVTEPRQVCMYLARQRTRFSLEEIGGYFGGRDHTTVMHSIRTVQDRCAADGDFARQLTQMDEQIQSGKRRETE
ncbi:MAG: chromosomal replication initiator protein DnaA [Phycisphaeraceae bacterium]